tara:strand:+ start:1433 stop:1774 length:342 start_codon:yes stop_codon:yes gene_type:complete
VETPEAQYFESEYLLQSKGLFDGQDIETYPISVKMPWQTEYIIRIATLTQLHHKSKQNIKHFEKQNIRRISILAKTQDYLTEVAFKEHTPISSTRNFCIRRFEHLCKCTTSWQ